MQGARPVAALFSLESRFPSDPSSRQVSRQDLREGALHLEYREVPHPHIVIEPILDATEYAKLQFPDDLIASIEQWGITGTDDSYERVLRDPTWRKLHDILRGEKFVRQVLQLFAEPMRRAGCLVDASGARLVDYPESRAEKALPKLTDVGDPNEIFTRLDFQSKGAGEYRPFVHLDWPRRVVGGILFFADATEEEMFGGELAFYRDRSFKNDRWCHEPEVVAIFPPRANTGVLFLNGNWAFHGPRAITRLRGRRRWLYYAISSRRDVWPTAAGQESLVGMAP